MARGAKSKKEIVRESMDSPKKIDTTIDFNIPRSPQQFDPSKHKYKCSACGKGFTQLKNNFQKSNSPLFQSNESYLPWCKECSDKYFVLLTALYSGNQYHAIEHFCEQTDWVYELNPLVSARETESGHRDRTILSHYAAKKNLNTDGRKTYIDTIKHNYNKKQDEVVQSKDDVKEKDISVTGTAIDRWGAGLTEWDYGILEEHYKLLRRNNPNADNNQEIFIKALANLNWLMMKNLRGDGDSDKYSKLVEQYAKTFKQAGLKTVEEKDSSNDETFCMTLGFISDYTPEEFYQDKELYKDSDGIGDYIERHVTRPMINLETGSSIRDKEFFVPETDDDYDEE